MNTESYTVNEILPLFIRQNSRTFVEFLEHYYDFVNKEGNPSYVISRIIEEHDIDQIVDEDYLDRIKYEIANNLPDSPYVQKAFLLSRIVDYYTDRGSIDSAKYFFKLFFNEDVQTYLPWDNVLIPSEGKWVQDTNINIVLYQGDVTLLNNTTIVQYDAGGRLLGSADIKNVIERISDGKRFYECTIRSDTLIGAFFSTLDVITTDGTCKGTPIRSVKRVKVSNPGTGYEANDVVYIKGKENISFVAIVEQVGLTGNIQKLNLIDRGIPTEINYKNISDITPEDNTTLSISGTISSGEIGGITLDSFPALLEGRQVNVRGTYNDGALIVSEISQYNDDDPLQDFVYTGTPPTGSALKTIPDVFVRTDAGVNAEFQLSFDTIVQGEGYYSNDKGRLSNFSVLQDSFYYQTFSYDIESTISITEWKDSFTDIVNPSGMKVFNTALTNNIIDLNLVLDTEMDIDDNFQVGTVIIGEELQIGSRLNVLRQDYAEEYFFFEDYVGTFATDVELQGSTQTTIEQNDYATPSL